MKLNLLNGVKVVGSYGLAMAAGSAVGRVVQREILSWWGYKPVDEVLDDITETLLDEEAIEEEAK